MKKLFIYYGFVLVTIMTVMGFIGAKSISQLVSAVLFFPLMVYFFSLAMPRRNRVLVIPKPVLATSGKRLQPKAKAKSEEPIKLDKLKGFDVDRRMFIKLIGSAGLTLFFFSIFTKKAEAAFFGSMPGPGTVAVKDSTGAIIDPAIKAPTDGYKITQLDDSTPAYYGFVNKAGNWFIMKDDGAGAYRYVKGASSFSTSWTNRATLTYDYFNIVFA